MNLTLAEIDQNLTRIVKEWVDSCRRGGKVSRNTIAVGIVVLDHLRRLCPVPKAAVISSGGEIKGARSGLTAVFARYTIPKDYLKEITTRQAHQDGQRLFEALAWGALLVDLSSDERDLLLTSQILFLVAQAQEWLRRQNIRLNLDRRHSPVSWVRLILETAKGRSGGVVEQHLVGATLAQRFQNVTIPNYPAHAGDQQTAREGDFTIAAIIYHVTANPSRGVLAKCRANVMSGKHPVLLVPAEQEYRAKVLAQDENVGDDITILSIESFVALNILELAVERQQTFYAVLQALIALYNARLLEVETDLSLQIEIE